MAKRVIPFGNRVIVRRRRIGSTAGEGSLIELPDEVKDRPTDIADVVYVPNHTFADVKLLENAQSIIGKLSEQMIIGDVDAFNALITLNHYMKFKMLRPGMTVFINKYVGMDFHDNEGSGMLCVVNFEDIIGVIDENKAQEATQTTSNN